MERVLAATIALTALFSMGMWIGYRSGFRDGIGTWRKDYRRMSADDVREHKRIIASMPDKA